MLWAQWVCLVWIIVGCINLLVSAIRTNKQGGVYVTYKAASNQMWLTLFWVVVNSVFLVLAGTFDKIF